MSTITFKLTSRLSVRPRTVSIPVEPIDSIVERSINAMLEAGVENLDQLESTSATPVAYTWMLHRNLIDHPVNGLETFLGRPVTVEKEF